VCLSFLFGIGLAVHQTLIFLLPGILYYLYVGRKISRTKWRQTLGFCFLFFCIGASIHFYLLFRSYSNPILDWEDPQTIERFWGLITRARYGFFQLAQGDSSRSFSLAPIFTAVVYTKVKLIESFGWIGLALMIAGSVGSLGWTDFRRLMMSMWIMLLFSGPFFFWLADIHLLKNNIEILDRFLLIPLLAGLILISLGLLSLITSKTKVYRWVTVGLLSVFIFETTTINAQLTSPSLRWNNSLRELGINAFRHIPENSYLFSDRADEFEFSIAYLTGVENRRPDITFVDCNAGVSKSIYGDDYYQIWGARRLARREKVEGEIIEKTDKSVFYSTVDPNMISIYRAPWGFLYRAWKLDQIPASKYFPWHEIMIWRNPPQSQRGRHVVRVSMEFAARYLFDGKFTEGARSLFGLAQKLGSDHRDVQMGYLYQKRGYRSNALKYYRQALESKSHSHALFANLGQLETRSGRYGEARNVYEQGLESYPNSVILLYALSKVYWKIGDWKAVSEHLENVLDLEPNHQEAARLLVKAKSYHRFSQKRKQLKKEVQKIVPESKPTPTSTQTPKGTPAPTIAPVSSPSPTVEVVPPKTTTEDLLPSKEEIKPKEEGKGEEIQEIEKVKEVHEVNEVIPVETNEPQTIENEKN